VEGWTKIELLAHFPAWVERNVTVDWCKVSTLCYHGLPHHPGKVPKPRGGSSPYQSRPATEKGELLTRELFAVLLAGNPLFGQGPI